MSPLRGGADNSSSTAAAATESSSAASCVTTTTESSEQSEDAGRQTRRRRKLYKLDENALTATPQEVCLSVCDNDTKKFGKLFTSITLYVFPSHIVMTYIYNSPP